MKGKNLAMKNEISPRKKSPHANQISLSDVDIVKFLRCLAPLLDTVVPGEPRTEHFVFKLQDLLQDLGQRQGAIVILDWFEKQDARRRTRGLGELLLDALKPETNLATERKNLATGRLKVVTE